MKFKIAYTVDNVRDHYFITAETIEQVMSKNDEIMKEKNLSLYENIMIAEKVED